jgi:hypothetical protein
MMYNSESCNARYDRLSQQLSDTETLGISDEDLQKIFHIIDTLVSLECCVYYQVIPLSVTNNCLILGIVNLEDSAAVNYIRSTIVYLKYSLQLQPIDIETHEVILSKYLKYHQTKEAHQKSISPPVVDSANDRDRQDLSEKPNFSVAPTISSPNDKSLMNSVDLPQQKSTLAIQKIELSPQISTQQLSKQLLAKVLQCEIGRLYFERHSDHGKIICSQEGKIQYLFDKLSIELFQGAIDELKMLVNLPKYDTGKIQKIEVEKTYKQEQVLLRFQIITNSKGEEGTLQVLRGKALKFYKQNKLEQIGKQALDLAQKLERKLYQIHAYSSDRPSPTESLVAIQTITQELSRYLE